MTSSILVTTLGASWAIVPELLGFTNPEVLDLYQQHPQASEIRQQHQEFIRHPVAEIWVVTTRGLRTQQSVEQLLKWASLVPESPLLRIWQAEGTDNLFGMEECRKMKELILRAVFHARQKTGGTGQLLISLAGGRKTMSADIQYAASLFGCDALLHVMDQDGKRLTDLNHPEVFTTPLSSELAQLIYPAVIGKMPRNILLDITPEEQPFFPEQFPLELPEAGVSLIFNAGTFRLQEVVLARLEQAQNVFFNFSHSLLRGSSQSSFMALYGNAPHLIKRLQDLRFGVDPSREQPELEWLRKLPKAELHCHLGGCASPEEILEMALLLKPDETIRHKAQARVEQWRDALRSGNPDMLRQCLMRQTGQNDFPSAVKQLRTLLPGLPEPWSVALFLQELAPFTQMLEKLIYGHYTHEQNFCGIGTHGSIEAYEHLGDFQGSALLQHPAPLKKAVELLLEKAVAHNVRYLEIRCSPINYTRGGMTAMEVLKVIQEVCRQYHRQILTKLIFIASRHGKMSKVYEHVELAQELWKKQELSESGALIGFDLAGDEKRARAVDMRPALMPLMERCAHLTIHAGETAEAESVWQAVYHLNASRIGHGLKLKDRPELIERFLNQRIAVEMCPSSNFQIIGFQDNYFPETTSKFEVYPLKEYLRTGLKVTVNTDNLGISRTDFTRELHKAARLTPGGLSPWDLLSLVRNSFRAGFVPFNQRRELLLNAEQEILEMLSGFHAF
ncbi:MAG: hypothetical protein HQM12_21280 [SAR324 cluster bacterium]|nr:hypothetical protein [SAR324 cluster bacterium]